MRADPTSLLSLFYINFNTYEMQQQSNETKELIFGNIMEVDLPSGYYARIREQNGEDDDIISNPVLAKDLTNLAILISSLVIETNLPFAVNGKLPVETIDQLLVNDQAVILLASRINSLGATLDFSYDWGDGNKYNYREELDKYLWKYITEPYPKEGEPEHFEYRCPPYHPNSYTTRELELTSGKKVKFKHMDVASQKKLISLPAEKMTKNSEFLIRDLMMEQEGEWVKVQNFKFFTSREMAAIRNEIRKYDKPFKCLTELENPVTGEKIIYPIMSNQNFFFPGEEEA